MVQYAILWDTGDFDEMTFDTAEDAEDYALEACSAEREGAEILHMSNPGDYEYDEDTFEATGYRIVKITSSS